MLLRLIPKVFYADIAVGVDLFVRGLGFAIQHQDATITVLGRDGAKVYLVEDAQMAALDRPELAIDTDDIESIYREVRERAPDLLHPNASAVALRPWGAREFAVLDATTVCVVLRQW